MGKKLLVVVIPLEGHAGFVMQLARALCKEGHSVTLASTNSLADKCAQRCPEAKFLGCPEPRTPEEEARHVSVGFDATVPPKQAIQGMGEYFTQWERAMYRCLFNHLSDEANRPDAILTELMSMGGHDAAERFNIPCVALATGPLHLLLDFTSHSKFNAPAHVPFESFGGPHLVMPEKMSMLQYWVKNPLMKAVGTKPISWWAVPQRDEVRKEAGLPPLQSMASFNEEALPALLYIFGISWLLETPRPLPDNMHMVGWIGADLKAAPPALEEASPIKAFMDAAQQAGQSVVYIAMGTMVPLSAVQVLMLAAAAASLGHSVRVVWSLKAEAHALLPQDLLADRVFVSSWVPQPAVLAHPATKLFVSHGGQNSTMEALGAGKPLLVLPFGADQYVNAQHVVNKGLGLQLMPATCKATQVASAIQRILTEPSFTQAAQVAGERARNAPSGTKLAADLINDFLAKHALSLPSAPSVLRDAEVAAAAAS